MSERNTGYGAEQVPKEIERKFLVRYLPENLDLYQHEQIRQGYLVIGADGSEARVRDRGGAFTLTVKSTGDFSRGEWEAPITAEQFETWWPATVGKRVEKVRYSIPYENHTIELDVYEGALRGWMIGEVEFRDAAEARDFTPPDWFGTDVTADKLYKNQSLATQGWPYDFTG